MNKSRWSKLLVFLAISIVLCACEDHAPVPPPAVQANSSIKRQYEIVVDVGALSVQSVTGRAQYDITNNQQCVKPDYSRALGGITDSYGRVVDLDFHKNDSGQFVATLIRDPFQDADYFGRGVCHWEFTGATLTLDGGIPTQKLLGLWGKDLSDSQVARVHSDYCAAEIQYTHSPPINICEMQIDGLTQEKRDHLFEVKTYNRKISP